MNEQAQEPMLEHFRSGNLTMGVIGLGYVGLPLATIVAEVGIRVIGFDIDEAVVDGVNVGASHIADVPSSRLAALVRAGVLCATADM